jgi:hypothetical protein
MYLLLINVKLLKVVMKILDLMFGKLIQCIMIKKLHKKIKL